MTPMPLTHVLLAFTFTFDQATAEKSDYLRNIHYFTIGGTSGGGDDTSNGVIINEVQANEPGSDTNGEGVELVNKGTTTADLSGWTVSDGSAVRHTFAVGTSLAPGKAITVFGGASAIPSGVAGVAASTGGLNLANGGDSVVLRNGAGTTIQSMTYTSTLAGSDGVSINRSPDGSATGSWVKHNTISSLTASLGKHADGSAY